MAIAQGKQDARCVQFKKEFPVTILSLALILAAQKKSDVTNMKSALKVDKNIHALRNFGSTRFVMIEMSSMG